jgi:prephenate dehydratase
MDETAKREPERILYLGPEGTFTHAAARDLAPVDAELIAATEAWLVIKAVDSGECDGGVVAFENSLDGTVGANIDKLLHEANRCLIAGERVLPVSFDLYRRREDTAELTRVLGHPVALGQAAHLLEERNLDAVAAASNVAALVDLAALEQPGVGALGPPGQAERFSLRVEAEHVEDSPAATRFVLLRKRSPAPTGRDLSAFVVRPAREEAGSLVAILQQFSTRGINLAAIKSRPTRTEVGDYLFYLECEGHLLDEPVHRAVLGLIRGTAGVRYLGSFPADPARELAAPSQPDLDAEREYEAMLGDVELP